MTTSNVAVRAGDVIQYIFCSDSGVRDEILPRQSVPDIETNFARPVPRSKPVNNLAHQNLPPVDQVCDSVEGTDRARLAQCLGKRLLTT